MMTYQGPAAMVVGSEMTRWMPVCTTVEPVELVAVVKPLPGQLPFMLAEYQVSVGLPSGLVSAEMAMA
jgi:hypothetical protein